MPDAFDDLQQAIDAAEQAAAAGNLATAEVHLDEVLRLQMHSVGEAHPDVAATFHKLAIVFERTGRIAEAEGMYRRAVAVASAALPADDPLLRQCSDDLTAFLAAASRRKRRQRRRRQAPPPAPGSASPVGPPPDRAPAPAAIRRNVEAPARAAPHGNADVAARRAWRPGRAGGRRAGLAIGGHDGGARLVNRRNDDGPDAHGDTAPAAAKPATPAPAARQPEPSTPPPARPRRRRPPPGHHPRPPRCRPHRRCHRRPIRRGRFAGGSHLGVRYSTPGCAASSRRPASGPCPTRESAAFGRYYYLTRLAAPATLQVEHRWYHGDPLVQSVPLTSAPTAAPASAPSAARP